MGVDFGVSLAFSVIFATGVTSGTAVTAIVSAGVILGYAAPAALLLGGSLYANYQAQKRLASVNDNSSIQSILKQAIPAQRLILGRATTGGALFFYKAKKPYIWYGILLAAHEVDAFENLIVNGHEVYIGADGLATSVPFAEGANQYLKVSFRNGHIDQAIDPLIAADFPTMPTTFRQRGHATIVIRAHYGFGVDAQAKDDDHRRVYGDQGVLQPLVRMRGAKLYDPRRGGAIVADPTTWTWSDNAALTMMRFLTHQWPSTRLVDPDRVEWDQVAAAANEADRWETSADGTTFRRHTVNGVVQATDNPFDVVESIKIAMGGDLVLDRAKIYPIVRSGNQVPEATLHVGMLRGGIEYVSEPRLRDMVNIGKSTFISPDREYQEVAGPTLRKTALITADGKPRETSLRGAYVEDHRRMQRLVSAHINETRVGRALVAGCDLEALPWRPGRIYRVHLPGSLAHVNGLYRLARKEWDGRLSGYRLTLLGYDPTAHDFAPGDELPFTLDDDTLEAEAA